MKILHISSAISWRGGERQIAYLMEGLHDKNIFSQLLCPKGSALSDYCEKNKLPYITLPKPSGFSLKWADGVSQLIKKGNFDIIHAHDSKSHSVCVLSNTFFGMKAPVIIHRRVLFLVGKNLFSRYKYRHPCIKEFICVSMAVEEVVKAVVPLKDFSVINDGIDIHKYDHFQNINYLKSRYPKTVSHNKIGYIAALTKEKDHVTFIKAASKINTDHPNTSFFIIGDGPLKGELIEMVRKMGLQEVIIFTGFINPLDPIIKELDLLLFTSVSEGYPSAIL
ncbi:MAG: glycosyltransferase, partial [Chitinophagaceae bacterium]